MLIAEADFGLQRKPAQQRVHRFSHILMHRQPVALLDFDQDVKGGWRAPFQDGFLGAAAAGFLVGKRDGFNPANQIRESGVKQQVLQRAAMRGGYQLHAAFGDGAGRRRFQLAPDFVNDDDLRIVVLNRFNHDLMLQRGLGDLHAAGAADCRVRHITVAANLVGCIHNHHAGLFGQNAGGLAQHGGFTDSRSPEQQNAFSGQDQVLNDINGAIHRPPHPAGEADNDTQFIAYSRNTMQGTFYPGTVVRVKLTDARHHLVNFRPGHIMRADFNFTIHKASHWQAPKIHDDLKQIIHVIIFFNRVDVFLGKNSKQRG